MTSVTAPAEPVGSPVRQRILAVADTRFYAEGIRTVSADRIIADAGVSKVTFYRHFPTKDDLVLAYLHGRSLAERDAVAGLRLAQAGDPVGVLTALAEGVVAFSCTAGFRGCPFINAAAEYADPTHPVRLLVAEHRAWFAALLADLLAELGIEQRSAVVEQLVMLRDGALVGASLGVGTPRAGTLLRAGRAVIEAARRAESREAG